MEKFLRLTMMIEMDLWVETIQALDVETTQKVDLEDSLYITCIHPDYLDSDQLKT